MKKKKKAFRRAPTHAEVRPITAQCSAGRHGDCIVGDCACHCHAAETSRNVAEHLHLKKHDEVRIPPTSAEVPPEKPQGELTLSSKTAPNAKLRTRPIIGARMFPGAHRRK